MNYNVLAYALVAVFITVTLSSNAFAQEQNGVKPCEFFTMADAEDLFHETINEQTERKTTFPAGHRCRYTFRRNGELFGLSVRISTSSELREEGINDSATDLFSRQKKARSTGGHAKKKLRLMQISGDEAFWNGSDLWVLKGDTVVIITVNSHLAGSYPDRQAADTAGEAQNLGLAKEAAAKTLSRM